MRTRESNLTRRSFLKATAAAAGGTALAGASTVTALAEGGGAPSDELTLAGYSCCTFATCGNCVHEVWTRDGKVVKTEVWAENPAGEIPCLRGRGALMQRTYGPRRLQYPMRRVEGTERGAGQWERISWDEAWADIEANIGKIIDEYGSQAVGWAGSNGCMSAFGTANIDHYTRMVNILGWTKLYAGWDDNFAFGRQLVVGDNIFMGPGVPNHVSAPSDSYQASFCIGSNRGPCGPYSWDDVMATKKSGSKLIVIDPVFTHMASIADVWVNLRPGSDPALFMGMINQVFERGAEATDFLRQYTVAPILVRNDNGRFLRMSDVDGTPRAPENDVRVDVPGYFLVKTKQDAIKSPDAPVVWDGDARAPGALNAVANPTLEGTFTVNGIECTTALTLLKNQVAEWTPAKVAEVCEVPEEVLLEITDDFLKEPISIDYMYGANWYWNSTESGRALATLEVVTGKTPPPSFRSSVAANVDLLTVNGQYPFRSTMSKAALHHLRETGEYRGEPFTLKGLFLAGAGGFVAGLDFNGTVEEILPMFDYIVGIDIVSCDTTDYCDLVLPACSNYEKWDIAVCGTKAIDQCIDPLFEDKEDYEIGCTLGKMFGSDEALFSMTKEEYAAKFLDTPTLQYYGVDLDTFRQAHIMNTWGGEPATEYDTPTGRLEFYTDYPQPKVPYGEPSFDFDAEHMVHWYEPLEAWPGSEAMQKHPFILISTRHYLGYHTQYFDTEWCSETEPGPTVRINPADAEKLGITDNMLVECYNDRGNAVAYAVLSDAVRPGMLVYPKGFGTREHKAGIWGALTRPEYAVMGQDALLFDCCVSIRPWEGEE